MGVMPDDDEVGSVVAELDLPQDVLEFIAQEWGIERLYPPQSEAIPYALSGTNLLLEMPTASGKSLVAYMAILRKLLVDEPGSRAVYIVPLKALASEKVDELQQAGEALGLNVGIAIGDRTGEAVRVDDADVLVCTSEKFDSMLRNRDDLLERVSVVIADEVHLIHDASRGPTLEVNLARVRNIRPDAQIIALSATVGNAADLADWLDATLISSDWRPVTLQYATECDLEVEVRRQVMAGGDEGALPPPRKISGKKTQPLEAMLNDVVADGGQLLCFVSTRRSAVSAATKLGKRIRTQLERDEDSADRRATLDELANKFQRGEDSSNLADQLAEAIRGGVAFHHAGLTPRQRRLVEDAFRERTLNCLVATPTLAAGVNLPARRVLVRDLRRWDGSGSKLLSVIEVQQMLGRAGRPRHDDLGEAWIHCKNHEDADSLAQYYLNGVPEEVVSKLHMEAPMRMHVLASIATGGIRSRWAIGQFFDSTFLAHNQPRELLADRIDGILGWLAEHEMINRDGEDEDIAAEIAASVAEMAAAAQSEDDSEEWDDELPPWAIAARDEAGIGLQDSSRMPELPSRRPKRNGPAVIGFQKASQLSDSTRMEPNAPESNAMCYSATPFGERISRLYLDPLSGHVLRSGLRRAVSTIAGLDESTVVSPFGLLHLISTVPDFLPLWPRQAEQDGLEAKRSATEDQMLVDRELLFECNLDIDPLSHTKCATALEAWIEEKSNRNIEQKLGVAPGDLRLRIDLAEWLLYSCREISRHDESPDEEMRAMVVQLMEYIDELRQRIRHGCREDLLQLVSLRNVGRARARTMASKGMRTIADVVEMTERDRSRLADERGWSPQLVENIVEQARRLSGRRR